MTSLMLMVTLGCNSECTHCCFACSPQKLSLSMTENEMISYIEQVHEYGIRSVTFTGGEPMLLNLEAPMLSANDLGMQIDIRTNAFWAKDYDKAFNILQYLQFLGLIRLGLSYDGYHAEAISPNCVMNALRAARELYLPVYLDWMGLHSRKQIITHLHLEPDELRYVGPPLRVGRATNLDDEHFRFIPIDNLRKDVRCGSGMPNILTVFPGSYASLYPCCWIHPYLIRKTSDNGWIEQLESEMREDKAARFLCNYGISGLIAKAGDEHPELLKPHYSHQCEACYDLLGSLFPGETQELPQYLEDFRGVT